MTRSPTAQDGTLPQPLPEASAQALALAWPVDVRGSTLTSCFGPRAHKNKQGALVKDNHPGIDIAQAADSPVYAAAAGKVIFSGPISGYGSNFVVIQHSAILVTSYGHMSSKLVRKGDPVAAQQPIGTVGNEGIGTGTHLHFNVTIGADPKNLRTIVNGNVDPFENGLTLPSGVANPHGCR